MSRSRSIRAVARPLSLILVTAFALSTCPLPAAAVPASLAERRAEAERIRAQVQELDNRVEMVIESYNQASEALSRTQGAVEQAHADLARARKRLRARQNALSRRVRGIYRNGDVQFFEVVLSTANFLDFLQQLDMLVRIGVHDADIVRDIKTTKAAIQKRQKELAVQLKARKAAAAQVAADKRDIEGRLAERERMLASVKDEIAAIQRREAAEQERLRRAAMARLARSGGSGGGDGGGVGGVYHPSGKSHGEVVVVAMAQLGKPYRYGAAGPDAFDCSGLTMYCYGQIGISLPHHSGSQIDVGERVGRSELEPGDLVFFGSPIHHVGIYIGGGEYVHAPNTGDRVKISSLDARSDFAGASRP